MNHKILKIMSLTIISGTVLSQETPIKTYDQLIKDIGCKTFTPEATDFDLTTEAEWRVLEGTVLEHKWKYIGVNFWCQHPDPAQSNDPDMGAYDWDCIMVTDYANELLLMSGSGIQTYIKTIQHFEAPSSRVYFGWFLAYYGYTTDEDIDMMVGNWDDSVAWYPNGGPQNPYSKVVIHNQFVTPWRYPLIPGVRNLIPYYPHELFHYLGLYHVWGPAPFWYGSPEEAGECADGSFCNTAGDLVCDTLYPWTSLGNTVRDYTCNWTGIGNNLDQCGGEYPEYNYPSYSNVMGWPCDPLDSQVTPGQGERMRMMTELYYEGTVPGDQWAGTNMVTYCSGDVYPTYPDNTYGDGITDMGDLIFLINNWGSPGVSDIDNSGTTGMLDLITLINWWGDCLQKIESNSNGQ